MFFQPLYKLLLNSRKSLCIIEDTPPVIQFELDLIAALGILFEFDVNILPLQGKKTIIKYGQSSLNIGPIYTAVELQLLPYANWLR